MMRHPLIKALLALFVTLFLMAQGFGQAHAAANGGIDHSHDGVACDVALVTAEQVQVAPPVAITAPVQRLITKSEYGLTTDVAPKSFDGRAPPPRGPPLL